MSRLSILTQDVKKSYLAWLACPNDEFLSEQYEFAKQELDEYLSVLKGLDHIRDLTEQQPNIGSMTVREFLKLRL